MKKMMIMAVATALGAAPAVAQMQGMDHSGMNHGQMMRPTPANPYPQAEMDMHQKMMSAMGADATETWVRKMVEHHRGGHDGSGKRRATGFVHAGERQRMVAFELEAGPPHGWPS